jgi:putative acetyltransferase
MKDLLKFVGVASRVRKINVMNINIDNIERTEVISLLKDHHQDMLNHSPVESVHALDLTALKNSDITFWTAWIDDDLAGCGALKMINQQHAEIKSMRTAKNHLRRGVAASLLKHILDYAVLQGYLKVSLETGSMKIFEPAHQLYQSFGFKECKPFADYKTDTYSLFMSKMIES